MRAYVCLVNCFAVEVFKALKKKTKKKTEMKAKIKYQDKWKV